MDPAFPAQLQSIGTKFGQIGWARPKEYLGDDQQFQLYKGQIEPNDILQGQLGDCYFLSSLSVLAERPILIKRLFENQEANLHGFYCLWLCINGEWQYIYLDDQIPCKQTEDGFKTVFSRAHDSELWVLLMEKAYAKCYGSY